MFSCSIKSQIELWNKPDVNLSTLTAVNSENDKGRAFLSFLRANNVQFKTVAKNLTYLIEMQKQQPLRGFRASNSFSTFHHSYHNFEDIITTFSSWCQQYRDVCKLMKIGKTHENRPILAATIEKENSNQKKSVLIECGIHAREWIAPAICMCIFQTLLQNQQNLEHHTFHMVPLLNPDGYAFSWRSQRLWRKNRRVNARNPRCSGVDLNRNFDINFCRVGASKDACSEVYCGPFAFSEPESKALRNFILNTAKPYATFHIHSYGQLIIHPHGYTRRKPPNAKNLNALAKRAVKNIKRNRGRSYKSGQTSSILYLSSGGADDWAFAKAKASLSYTIEGRDNGNYGFMLPQNQILPACTEVWIAISTILSENKNS
ncbi:carboxypeptidase B-like protein [Dinothrombium tinctorium]|uniref:Carboxypeptidase B-like protein n=1 Tax=Dinothrombium tinctorium TaxID=1965070 RepID=A0A3S3QR76_9ACAR|nr:carboxypeptidase B-like protein [Dinothrombium tinctorium]